MRNTARLRGMKTEDRSGIKSVEVAARILDHLSQVQGPVALRDLAAAGGMSPGKVHRYLVSFVASGLASQDADTRQYVLGPLALRLGLAALGAHRPLRDAMALQHELRDRLDETMVLSVWGSQGPTIVHIAESTQSIVMTMRVGSVLPMLQTATGLAFAAFLPRALTAQLIKPAFEAADGVKLLARSSAALERLTAQVRKQGYAFNEGSLMPGVSAVAFPLVDRASSLVAVLAVMGSHERLDSREGARLIAEIRTATRAFAS
jgi:DNA-binding IclR family transcriptional regulator